MTNHIWISFVYYIEVAILPILYLYHKQCVYNTVTLSNGCGDNKSESNIEKKIKPPRKKINTNR